MVTRVQAEEHLWPSAVAECHLTVHRPWRLWLGLHSRFVETEAARGHCAEALSFVSYKYNAVTCLSPSLHLSSLASSLRTGLPPITMRFNNDQPCRCHDVLLLDDVLRYIFSYLEETAIKAASLVCKAWSGIAEEILWTDVALERPLRILAPIYEDDEALVCPLAHRRLVFSTHI